MKIAYFVNQYPKVSHTFIRREILTLEGMGLQITRCALRGWDAQLTDPLDEGERSRTRYVLRRGPLPVLWIAMLEALRRPLGMLRALRLALRVSWNGERTLAHHLFSVAEAAALTRSVRMDGIDHVHAHFGTNSAEICMLAKRLSGLSYSFTVHGPDEWDQPRQLKIRDKVEHATFVVAISYFTRAQVLRWCRIEDQEKVHVVHCGLGDELLDSPAVPLPDTPVFVCVGRLCTAKSQALLVEAIARVRAHGVPVSLLLVGDGEARPEVEEAIRIHRLGEFVRITGWASDHEVRQYIVGSQAFVLPSLAEDLPVAIMEAMALGRPVIATYVGGISELIRNGQEGWLVSPGNLESLAEAMIQALSVGKDKLTAIGLAAKQRVAERHRSETECRKLLRHLQQPA
jgi:glycosyltransferase involved in cell wall biosynthesis